MKTNHEKVETDSQLFNILVECEKWQTDDEIDELSHYVAIRLLENGITVDFQIVRTSPKDLTVTIELDSASDQRQDLKKIVEQHFSLSERT